MPTMPFTISYSLVSFRQYTTSQSQISGRSDIITRFSKSHVVYISRMNIVCLLVLLKAMDEMQM